VSAVKQAPMTGTEVLDEVEWLLDGGMHPTVIAQQLGRKVGSIHKLAWQHGRDRVREAFTQSALVVAA
jgi:hypothetical protein